MSMFLERVIHLLEHTPEEFSYHTKFVCVLCMAHFRKSEGTITE